jgi:radical SAM protein with 4Fe4S-binding SPASM domain
METVNSGYAIKRNIGRERLWKGNEPQLGHLDIELTERCNNACIHCYINLPVENARVKRRELKTDQWKDILQQAADLGALSVRFTGGEPLLRDDFTEIYLIARRLGMQVILFTNARRITPELADLFVKVPPQKKIEISVYGMHPQSYDAVACSPGAFNEFQRGINLLNERGIPFIVKSVCLPSNRSEIDEFETWAVKIPWMDKHPSYALFLELRTRRDSEAKNQLIRSLRLSPEEGLAFVTRSDEAYRRGMSQFSTEYMGPQGDRLFSCGAGETGCVDAYGVYQMCMPLRHPDTVYDLKQGTLYKGLTEVFPRLRELHATNPIYLDHCAHCFLKGLCEQCPGKSWEENGTLDTPVDYLCLVAHAQARYLGLLGEDEQGWEVDDWQMRLQKLAIQKDVARLG